MKAKRSSGAAFKHCARRKEGSIERFARVFYRVGHRATASRGAMKRLEWTHATQAMLGGAGAQPMKVHASSSLVGAAGEPQAGASARSRLNARGSTNQPANENAAALDSRTLIIC